ncbi:alpha/beta fold hydrolase [Sphaerotilus mobilis]|uniref:Pimeloyl-ACP methyl ester carboxylesterase n=1 Tax=Sphaerotilus mobilis TaxID=47994 RepID=A0A4Q7L9L2_9BURK|nr:alpha/beta fold hydrolase [Sphaerotilus mobilis]RZS46694.1 pimeloyl-ACP methyl ester carboxylesterase [Sphaerotilus mobilis]
MNTTTACGMNEQNDGRSTLRYVKSGKGDQTLLLIHGLGCSSMEWSENIEPLSRRMTVIAVDLIGFGSSDKPTDFDYTARSQARRLLALMDTLGVDGFHVAGNSFGGKVAIEMTDLAAHRIRSLTLVDSAGAGREAPKPMRLSTLPLLWRFTRQPTYDEFRQGWQAAFHDPKKLTEARVQQKFFDAQPPKAQRSHRQTVVAMMNVCGFHRNDLEALERMTRAIRCPTLIVWGRQDLFLPVSHAEIFKARIPGATLEIFEECGHAPQIERADLFNPLLEKFIFAS